VSWEDGELRDWVSWERLEWIIRLGFFGSLLGLRVNWEGGKYGRNEKNLSKSVGNVKNIVGKKLDKNKI
jgi:hypothetical protein